MLAIWSLVSLPFLSPACTSGSSWFTLLLKPSLEDFELYLASMQNECNCMIVWTFFGIALLWDWKENRSFPVGDHCWVFQICWQVECGTLTASSFRIWNNSAGILPPLLAVFVVTLPKAHLTSQSRISSSRLVSTPLWLSGSLRPFLCGSSVHSCHLLSYVWNNFCVKTYSHTKTFYTDVYNQLYS